MTRSRATVLYTSADASLQSGAFRSLLFMASQSCKMGVRPVLVTSAEDRETTINAVENNQPAYYLRLPRAKRNQPLGYYLRYLWQNVATILQLREIIRRENVDIVHANEILDFYAPIAARLAGIPCVWHVRTSFAPGSLYHRLIPRIAHRLASRIVVVSNSVREDLFCQQGLDSTRTRVLYNPGPDPDIYHPGIDGSRIREEFDLGEQPLVVLVAKLIEDKGHETLIASVPLVIEQLPSVKFMVVGGELPGKHHEAYARKLRSLPRKLGVEQSVIFTGYRPDIPEIMAAADLVVHCSTYPDPFPGVVLQGMATGKAVIATHLGGTKEQIDDGISGVLIEPNQPDQLAHAIIELLNDDERRLSLGARAARSVREQFTTERFLAGLTEIYDELLPRPA